MQVEYGSVADADAVADRWVALANEQVEFGSRIEPERNRSVVREAVARHAVADQLIVARDDDRVVGFVTVDVDDGRYETVDVRGVVENLYVAPEYRDRGLGSTLLERAEAVLRERDVDRISLDAMADNEAARRFYRRHGYESHRVRLDKPVESDSHKTDPG